MGALPEALSADPRRRNALLSTIVACTVFALGELLLAERPTALRAWADVWWTAASFASVATSVRAIRAATTRHRRLAWTCFGLACLSWALGMIAWDIDELVRGRVTPFPALSDVGFLALVPFLVPGFVLYGEDAPSGNLTLKNLGDLGTLIPALVFVAAVVYSHPIAAEHVPREGLLIAAGNAVAHLGAIAFGLIVYWQRAWGPERRVLRILLAALAVKSGVTTVYGYALLMDTYEVGHTMDVFWVLTFCLFAWAGLEEVWLGEHPANEATIRMTVVDTMVPAIAILAATSVAYAFRANFTPELARLGYAMSVVFAISVGLRAYASRRLEQHLTLEVQSKNRQLVKAQKMEAVGTLAGGIAHDFNNMLTGMMAAATMLKRHLPKESRSLAQLELLNQSIRHASELSRRLLALARSQETEMGAMDAAAVVRRVAKLLRGTLPENVEVHEDVEASELRMLGSAGLLEQALLNLGINAGHAMPKGGTLRLSVARRERRGRPYVVFEVEDTGVGIPEAIRDRVFEPFFTTREPGRGTGLGLAMVYAAVQEHGGEVELDSEVGSGSTFRLVLPWREPEARADETAETTLELPRGTESLLVVDDQDAPLIGVKTILQEAGYDVRLAWSGLEALHRLEVDPMPALVITDCVMPRMGGAELLSAMRDRGIGIPVILMTGYGDPVPEHRDGFAAVLHKPFSPEELAHVVRRVLDEQRTSDVPSSSDHVA